MVSFTKIFAVTGVILSASANPVNYPRSEDVKFNATAVDKILDEASSSEKKVTSELKKIEGCVANELFGINDADQLAKNYLFGGGLESFNITKQYNFIHSYVEALNTTDINLLISVAEDVGIYVEKAAPDAEKLAQELINYVTTIVSYLSSDLSILSGDINLGSIISGLENVAKGLNITIKVGKNVIPQVENELSLTGNFFCKVLPTLSTVGQSFEKCFSDAHFDFGLLNKFAKALEGSICGIAGALPTTSA